jgi:hypothetical protein
MSFDENHLAVNESKYYHTKQLLFKKFMYRIRHVGQPFIGIWQFFTGFAVKFPAFSVFIFSIFSIFSKELKNF